MKSELPFKHEEEANLFNYIHPLIRFILPFIFVVPCLFIANLYLIITILIFISLINVIFHLHLIQILSRLKILIPFVLLMTIFIPFYYGNTILVQFSFVFPIIIYSEGLKIAALIFLRVILAAFTFLSFFSSLTYSEYIESLTKIRVIPAFFVGSIVIMLHYIPILASSNKKILEAQEIRGKNITKYWQRLKTHAYIMAKNVVQNMERSEHLYDSLKMRGFTGKLTFAPKRMKFLDYLVLILSVGLMISLIYFIDLEYIFVGVIRLFMQ
ncbi:MAG: energy-coupling factor transporter transmembrane protein EcfT [Candidatus Lokiarchaeota archaeon]|nr:energy-coupling factor transporter transmembrane protein EcfT [Candidatus Lokiarchaeota archaeon]